MHSLYEPVSALMREVAETIMMPRFRKLATHEVREKTPGDLVTIVDNESELRIAEGLRALVADARVVGEEASAADATILERLDEGAVWIVDPLDGTMNFAEGKHPFAIMIGLLVDGERTAGWILDPGTGRMVHAVRGGGAFVDGRPVRTQPTEGDTPVAAIALHFLSEERRAELIARAEGRLDLVPIPRCAGEQYPRLVLGQNDIALFERTNAWDHVPGALFLEEAGGKVGRPDGAPYREAIPGTGMIAAASSALWDRAQQVLFG